MKKEPMTLQEKAEFITNDYFTSAWLSYHINKGNIVQPKPKHDNPLDYDKTKKWAIKRALIPLRVREKELKKELSFRYPTAALEPSIIRDMVIEDLEKELKITRGKIYFYKERLKYVDSDSSEVDIKQSFDVQFIRENNKIENFVEVNALGFFKVRNEKTPSCKLYKNDNTWVDFGDGGRKKDVIDLICILHNTDFIGACKFLNNAY